LQAFCVYKNKKVLYIKKSLSIVNTNLNEQFLRKDKIMTAPLMPKATAVWLIDNTTLTFRQIADFCEIHELEIQAIADGDIAYNIRGVSPVGNGQLSWEEIHRCEADKNADLKPNILEKNVKEQNAKAKKILSPSQRNDKPAAVLWILKHCPEIMDSQICKLIGTTKPTIAKIRNGEHADMANLKPKNPVAVGLCNEKDLESALEISKAHMTAKEAKKAAKKKTVKKAKKAVAAKTTTKKVSAKKDKKAKSSAAAKAKSAKKETKSTTKKTVDKKTKTAVKKNAAAKKQTTAKKAAKVKATDTKTVKKTSKKAAVKKISAKKDTVSAATKTATGTKAKKAAAKTKNSVKKATASKAVKTETVKKSAKKTVSQKTAGIKTAAKKTTAKK